MGPFSRCLWPAICESLLAVDKDVDDYTIISDKLTSINIIFYFDELTAFITNKTIFHVIS